MYNFPSPQYYYMETNKKLGYFFIFFKKRGCFLKRSMV